MKRSTIWLAALAATLNFAQGIALAQRGHGGGMSMGHAAPPMFSAPQPRQAAPMPPQRMTAQPMTARPMMRGNMQPDVRAERRLEKSDLAATRIASRVNSNRPLARNVRRLLPPGTSVQTASAGFKNQGQFLAALHVSRNLGIPFAQLKARMTGPQPESLGRAIQDLRPRLSKKMVKTDVKLAERQAKNDSKRG